MPATQIHEEAVPDSQPISPKYWLVHALPWPGGEVAAAAVAYTPELIPRDGLSRGAQQILACADLVADRWGERVIFFSDLTGLLARGGSSWSTVGIEWTAVLSELKAASPYVAELVVSQATYVAICTSADADEVGSKAPAAGATGRSPRLRSLIERQLGLGRPDLRRPQIGMIGVADAIRAAPKGALAVESGSLPCWWHSAS